MLGGIEAEQRRKKQTRIEQTRIRKKKTEKENRKRKHIVPASINLKGKKKSPGPPQ
jgi:hypothetical protein